MLIDNFVARCQLCCYLQFTTVNKILIIFILSIWYLHTKAEILIVWLIEASRRPVQNSYVCKLWYPERKKLSHFDMKSWVTCGTKIRPRKEGNYRIFESNWLNIKSPIDSTLKPNWLNITSPIDSTLRVQLTQHWESNWLNIEIQIGSTLRVKLTQHWESR